MLESSLRVQWCHGDAAPRATNCRQVAGGETFFRFSSCLTFFPQHHTQRYGKRPYGVGLLVAGYDSTGPHIFETCPSGNFYDFYAQAIGARSQAAKTYLEKKLSSNQKKEERRKLSLTKVSIDIRLFPMLLRAI